MPLVSLYGSDAHTGLSIMIERFLELLIVATTRIPCHYFQLPIAGGQEAIYRERVYSYELYHQLRKCLDEDGRFGPYALSGEISKQGHPIIRPCAPDFVFHVPGRMRNLVVVEVKPVNATAYGIRKDLKSLKYFLSKRARYQLGVQLVYGDDRAFARFEKLYREADQPQLQLFWHRRPGGSARRII